MEKSKEHSVFRAETSGVSPNSCSFVQWVHLYHYCTIKWFIVIDICLNRSHNSGYSVSNHTSAPPWSTPGCWRREWLWGRRSGSTGESLCSEWEGFGLLDLCDTRLRFVLPPGEMFWACQAGWRPRVRARTCWNDFISYQFMDCFSDIPEELEKVTGERMALAPLVKLLLP